MVRWILVAVAAAWLFSAMAPVQAATCRASVRGANVSETEADAKRLAILAWSSKARSRYGAGYANFDAAVEKRINCGAAMVDQRQRLVCTVSARPCSG